jgi:hypothetical protein
MNQTTVNSDAGSDLKSSAGADEMRKLRSLLEDPVTAVRKLKTGELRREYAHDKAKADICRRWEKKVSLKGPAGLKPFADFLCEISGGLEGMFQEPAEIGDLVLNPKFPGVSSNYKHLFRNNLVHWSYSSSGLTLGMELCDFKTSPCFM